MIQRNFVVFTVSAFLFLIAFSAPSLIASPENSNKPPFKSSSSQSEISNPPSVKSNPSNPQSAIRNPQLDKAEFAQKTKKLQIPFIANNGQTNEKVKFYANTFGGTVFVTKDGEIVYSLPNNSSDVETQCLASLMHSPKGIRDEVGMLHDYHVSDIMHPASWIVGRGSKSEFQNLSSTSIGDLNSGVAIKETLVGGRVQEITGNEKAVTKVSYFKGNDKSQWKTNISTYDVVSLGEVYDGIELKLKAYGNNVEKLFCVKSGADTDQIKIKLSGIQTSGNPPPLSPSRRGTGGCPPLAGAGGGLGARGLWVNDEGQLVAETELGAVKFTKPIAYQEINGKRVDVECKYTIADCGMQNADCKTNPKSEFQNPNSENPKSAIQNVEAEVSNPKSKIANHKLEYGFRVASYDKSHDLIIDPLLASTYLGASNQDFGYSLTLDTTGNVYVTGYTYSKRFPTTSGAYDTSYSDDGGYSDVFVSKLDGGLTTLLASTYLGGSDWDQGYSLALDTSGNVYVTGNTSSTDFPTTSGAYDTSFNSGTYGGGDVFISKLNSGLTTLLASTYLGGSSSDVGNSLTLDTSGNVYVTGNTSSTDFPMTSGAYDTSQNGSGSSDVFVSKLNSGLTSLLASTYLGGSGGDYGYSLTLDTSGNVYVTGDTLSTGFPTTSGAYDTSSNGGDVFISKLNSGLTSLLASTYLGGSGSDYGRSLTLDISGNVYVTGYTDSTDFPTTSGTYYTSFNGGDYDVFVSKLNSGLTSMLASTYLGGSDYDYGYFLALDTSGNLYVVGYTWSSDFPTASEAYDTSYSGGYDVFVSKLGNNLSATKPTATTSSATNVTASSTILNGTVNANGQSTTAWFNYGTGVGLYTGTSTTQSVSGSGDTLVSIGIGGLSPGTTYYYRIAAQNIIGITYGDEMSFNTLSDISAPEGMVVINEGDSYTNDYSVNLTLSADDAVGITGYYISTNSTKPASSDSGWVSVTSNTNYYENVSYTLSIADGEKTLYVWYKDASGNISSATSDSIILDTTAPAITITSPTTEDNYTTSSSVIAIGGSASDSTSGISFVTWSNDKSGSGMTSGTTSWLTSSISLLNGENIITVTATDEAGNTGTDQITVILGSGQKGSISGYVVDKRGNPIESAKIRLKGTNSKILRKTSSDEDGLFEFTDLDADTYTITAITKGYKTVKQTITLEAGEEKDIEIVMKRTTKKGIYSEN